MTAISKKHEKFMEEFFGYRSLLELGLRKRKNFDFIPIYWKLKGMASEELKEKLPTFKKMVKEIEKEIEKDSSV